MDATRTSDGQYVALKMIVPGNQHQEIEILQYLSSAPLRSDPRNTTVPLFEVLDVPATDRDDAVKLVAMPLLRPWDDPWFDTYGETIAFFTYMLNVIFQLFLFPTC